jgi:hypothetical protein
MSNEQIINLFDCNPNLMLSELAIISGKSVKQLKKILMESTND